MARGGDPASEKDWAIAEAYKRRENGVNALKATFGINGVQLYAALGRTGTPRRGSPRRDAGPGAAPGKSPSGRGAGRDPSISRRLERILAARVAALERKLAVEGDVDPEATARALALNARTLATLRRVTAGHDDDAPNDTPERPQRSLAELRDDLRAAFLRLRVQSKARRRRDRAEHDAR